MTLGALLRTPTQLAIGGRTFRALPLRLRDIAELEALALSCWADPLDTLPGIDPPDDPATAAALKAACDEIEYHRPLWGTDACMGIALCTRPGQALVASAVLRAEGLPFDDVLAMVPMEPGDWNRLCRVAFGQDSMAAIVARIDRYIGAPVVKAKGESWAKAVCVLAAKMGVPPCEMAEWTIPEFNMLCAEGPPDPWGVPKPDSPEWPEFNARVQPKRHAFFWGKPNLVQQDAAAN